MVRRVWSQFGKHLDIVIMLLGLLVTASMAWANINSKLESHDKQLAEHSTAIKEIQNDSHATKENTVRIEQKLDDLTLWIRKRNDD